MIEHLLFLIVGGALVWLGAEGMVNGAVKLANYYGVSAMIVGLTVVAFGTSAPELVVSSMAAAQGHSAIAIGNVLGSNIINIALVLGFTAIISPIFVDKDTYHGYLPMVAFVSIVVVAMAAFGGFISRIDGIILLLAFAGYTVYTFYKAFHENKRATMVEEWVRPELKPKHIVYLIGGTGILALGAEGMVRGAVGVAQVMGISEQIIAMTIVAFGTSVPELAASIVAAKNDESDLAIGNVLGSNFYNMTLILGTASVINPVPTSVSWTSIDYISFLIAILVLYPMMIIRKKIGRIDGTILLVLYAISVPLLFL
jgi:cation:H+ antiporter